jgi:Ca2+-binding EF-hand superfamily protein
MELTMIKALLGGAALAALIAIAPANAQSGQAAPGAQAPQRQHGAAHSRAQLGVHVAAIFQRLDTDRDGVITRAESQAAKGYRGERKSAIEQRRASRSPERRAETRAALFDRLDANRDGSISRAEFTAAPALRDHRHAARTGGQVERRTEHGRMMRGAMGMGAMGIGLRGHMFDMADANRDGRVTMAEATAAAYRHFDMADANRDGQVTRDERMQMRQRMRAERQPG